MRKRIISSKLVGTSMLATLIDNKLKQILKESYNDIEDFKWEIKFKTEC